MNWPSKMQDWSNKTRTNFWSCSTRHRQSKGWWARTGDSPRKPSTRSRPPARKSVTPSAATRTLSKNFRNASGKSGSCRRKSFSSRRTQMCTTARGSWAQAWTTTRKGWKSCRRKWMRSASRTKTWAKCANDTGRTRGKPIDSWTNAGKRWWRWCAAGTKTAVCSMIDQSYHCQCCAYRPL